MFAVAFEQLPLFSQVHQAHRSALEAEVSKLLLGNFQENIDDGIAQAAELVFAWHIVVRFKPRDERSDSRG